MNIKEQSLINIYMSEFLTIDRINNHLIIRLKSKVFYCIGQFQICNKIFAKHDENSKNVREILFYSSRIKGFMFLVHNAGVILWSKGKIKFSILSIFLFMGKNQL